MWRRVKRFLRDVQLGSASKLQLWLNVYMWYEWCSRNGPGGATGCLMEAIIQQHPLGKSEFHAVDNHINKLEPSTCSWLPCWLSSCHQGTAIGLFLIGSYLLPLKTRKTGLSPGDSASWPAVRESQVTVHSHSTAPIRRSLRMDQHLSCSQFKGLGVMCREEIKGLRNKIMRIFLEPVLLAWFSAEYALE